MTCALKIKFVNRLPEQQWILLSKWFFAQGAHGIDEGEEGPPEGEKALITAALEETDEFIASIKPGVLLPPEAIIVYFSDKHEELSRVLSETSLPIESMQWEDVVEADYDAIWKSSFQPMYLNQLLVRAPWHEVVNENRWPEIVIEPGMAFGTGTHETTQGCLEYLVELAQNKTLGSVLDFGCGSGILAIAAKKLGADRVLGTDIDPLSIAAVAKNAALNDLIIDVFQNEIGVEAHNALANCEGWLPFDGIVANILKNTLKEYAASFHTWLKPNGWIILSGLLLHQKEEVITYYTSHGFVFVSARDKNDWTCLYFVRQGL